MSGEEGGEFSAHVGAVVVVAREGPHVGVAREPLRLADVALGEVEDLGDGRVAEPVRPDPLADAVAQAGHEALDRTAAKPAVALARAVERDEDRAGFEPAHLNPRAERGRDRRRDREALALGPALAEDREAPTVEVDVRHVERDDLAAPEAHIEEEPDNGPVADRLGAASGGGRARDVLLEERDESRRLEIVTGLLTEIRRGLVLTRETQERARRNGRVRTPEELAAELGLE